MYILVKKKESITWPGGDTNSAVTLETPPPLPSVVSFIKIGMITQQEAYLSYTDCISYISHSKMGKFMLADSHCSCFDYNGAVLSLRTGAQA